MNIDIITLFPDMFKGPFDESMIKRAQDKSFVSIHIHQLRNWAIDARGTVDGHPFGGGPGMLLRPEPIFQSVEEIKNSKKIKNSRVVLLDAGGSLFNQRKAEEYSKLEHLIFICGHYEGVDYRIHEFLADEIISVGDYVLTGGEIPAMIVVDSVVRLIPGVLHKEDATTQESFSDFYSIRHPKSEIRNPTVEYPQYTRPDNFRGFKVPEVLKSGNHGEIDAWRTNEAIKRTKKNRPDLIGSGQTIS